MLISEQEGLFHGGTVSGICPPDIYGVVVDGERGSRPRILSTEELLHEAVSCAVYRLFDVCEPSVFPVFPSFFGVLLYECRPDHLLPGRVESLTGCPDSYGYCSATRRKKSSSHFLCSFSVNVIGSEY